MEMVTVREPEWDEIDRTMIATHQDWEADLHSCGRPRSESLKDTDKPDPEYQPMIEVCLACQAIDRDVVKSRPGDEKYTEAGGNPESWRIRSVLPLADCPPEVQAFVADQKAEKATRAALAASERGMQ